MLLLTVAPSPSLCCLAKTFFTTALGLSNWQSLSDPDMVLSPALKLLMKPGTGSLGLSLMTGFLLNSESQWKAALISSSLPVLVFGDWDAWSGRVFICGEELENLEGEEEGEEEIGKWERDWILGAAISARRGHIIPKFDQEGLVNQLVEDWIMVWPEIM